MDKKNLEIINKLSIKKLEELFRLEKNQNKKEIYGAGFFKKLKDLGIKAYNKVKNLFPNTTKDLFQLAANSYRKLYGNATTRKLYPGEYHYLLHNYTGPGTQIHRPEVYNAKPYNNIDNASRTHDIDYLLADKEKDPIERALKVQKADLEAIKEYNKYPNEDGYLAAKTGILTKWRIDQLLSALKGKPSSVYGTGIKNLGPSTELKKKKTGSSNGSAIGKKYINMLDEL